MVLLVGAVWLFAFRTREKIDSVAVLPFANVTTDPNSEYVSEGLTEDLISGLSELPDIAVRPRSSVARYQGKEPAPEVVARDLGVAAVVAGRVTVHGDSLLVATELIDARNARNLWSARFDRKMDDLIVVRHEIEDEITSHLRHRQFSAGEQARTDEGGTSDPEAYRLYLIGRYYSGKRTEENMDRARDYFEQALARDPSYALPYVDLADYWTSIPDYSSIPKSQALPQAKDAAEKALSLAKGLPAAHGALANYYLASWQWAAAESELKWALDLDPNLSTAHHQYGLILSFMGRPQEAIAQLQRAVELEPVNVRYNFNLGNGFANAHQYDRAIEQWNRTIDLDPDFAITRMRLARVYFLQGRYEEWLAEWKRAAALFKAPQVTALQQAAARGYSKTGVRGAVSSMIQEQLNQQAQGMYVDSANIAYNYAFLGDEKNTFRSLDAALKERAQGLQYIKITRELDSFHSDPRYRAILRQMGLPE